MPCPWPAWHGLARALVPHLALPGPPLAPRSQGGMLLGAQSFKLTGISNVYAICPHGMPDACVRDLERACKEFK